MYDIPHFSVLWTFWGNFAVFALVENSVYLKTAHLGIFEEKNLANYQGIFS